MEESYNEITSYFNQTELLQLHMKTKTDIMKLVCFFIENWTKIWSKCLNVFHFKMCTCSMIQRPKLEQQRRLLSPHKPNLTIISKSITGNSCKISDQRYKNLIYTFDSILKFLPSLAWWIRQSAVDENDYEIYRDTANYYEREMQKHFVSFEKHCCQSELLSTHLYVKHNAYELVRRNPIALNV